jgi:hypothetical protein
VVAGAFTSLGNPVCSVAIVGLLVPDLSVQSGSMQAEGVGSSYCFGAGAPIVRVLSVFRLVAGSKWR